MFRRVGVFQSLVMDILAANSIWVTTRNFRGIWSIFRLRVAGAEVGAKVWATTSFLSKSPEYLDSPTICVEWYLPSTISPTKWTGVTFTFQ